MCLNLTKLFNSLYLNRWGKKQKTFRDSWKSCSFTPTPLPKAGPLRAEVNYCSR